VWEEREEQLIRKMGLIGGPHLHLNPSVNTSGPRGRPLRHVITDSGAAKVKTLSTEVLLDLLLSALEMVLI
jgi:hypothetical protein